MKARVAVVGAGIAGMSAACHAALSGFEVDVYEQHSVPGGLCTSWRIDGYLFDGCVEYLIGSGPKSPFYRLWEEVGVVPRPFAARAALCETSDAQGRRVVLWADPDVLQPHLLELAPDDARPIALLCELVRLLRVAQYRVDTADELMGLRDHLRALKAIWPTRKAWSTGTRLTVRAFAAQFKSPLLQRVLLTAIPPELPLLSLLFVLSDLANGAAGTPIGGSLKLALSMAQRCKSLGVRFHFDTKVQQIVVEHGAARALLLGDGQRVDTDVVIAAGDLRHTLDQLLGGRWPSKEHEALFQRQALVPSVCIVSFGLRGALPRTADAVVHRFLLPHPEVVEGHPVETLAWKTFEHDPTLAPRPKTVMSVTLDSTSACWTKVAQDRAAYDAKRAALGRGITALLERAIPGFSSLVETVDVATPVTVERYTSNHGGHYMTFIPVSGRPPRHAPRRIPGIRDLLLAGMWVAPPGGLPNALKSGRDAVQVLCRERAVPFHGAAALAGPQAGAPHPA